MVGIPDIITYANFARRSVKGLVVAGSEILPFPKGLCGVHDYDCCATATKNKHVHFSARSHEVAANHNAGISTGVAIRLDQLSWQCLHIFHVLCGRRWKVSK